MPILTRRQFMDRWLRRIGAGLGGALLGCPRANRSGGTDPSAPDGTPAPVLRPDVTPAYLALRRDGELRRRGEALRGMMTPCRLCPRECGADRLGGQRGFCGADGRLEISAFHPHFGEESPLVGTGGSGAIFLTHCGLRCVFCINWEISQGGRGSRRQIGELADMMLALQRLGCGNINVVTPTHYSAHIVLALDRAAAQGLRLPLVYNTCGWERLEILRLLDGVVDIYLPDFKYTDSRPAAAYSSGADAYPELTRQAVLEMHRQVGVARPAADGRLYRGLIIRHLVMPKGVGGTRELVRWIAANLPRDTYVNLMSQYRPTYRAVEFPEINRRITRAEYDEAVRWAREAGLTNLDLQGFRL
jgi:putative pyruvate formate lyase activating enzyme